MIKVIKENLVSNDKPGEKYFEVEKDTSYVQEEPDMAIAIYDYYISNPNGDGDGKINVSEFENEDGSYSYQIDGYEDAFNAPNGELYRLLMKYNMFEKYNDKKQLEWDINMLFKDYVNEFLN